jgi:hypothetical protein
MPQRDAASDQPNDDKNPKHDGKRPEAIMDCAAAKHA